MPKTDTLKSMTTLLERIAEVERLGKKARESFELAKGKAIDSFEQAASFSDEMHFRQELEFLISDNPGLLRDGVRWQALKELAGYWQDGSQTQVILDQDDATRTAFISVGNATKKAYLVDGRGFDAAIDQAMKETK